MIPERQETWHSHKSAQLTALGEFSGRGTRRRNSDRACGLPKLRKWSWESKEAKVARAHKGDQHWVESWREREKWRHLQKLIPELLVEHQISTYICGPVKGDKNLRQQGSTLHKVTNTYFPKAKASHQRVRKETGIGWKDSSVVNTNNLISVPGTHVEGQNWPKS